MGDVGKLIDQLGHTETHPDVALAMGIAQARQVARTQKAALEHRSGVKVPLDARILCGLVEFGAYF